MALPARLRSGSLNAELASDRTLVPAPSETCVHGGVEVSEVRGHDCLSRDREPTHFFAVSADDDGVGDSGYEAQRLELVVGAQRVRAGAQRVKDEEVALVHREAAFRT